MVLTLQHVNVSWLNPFDLLGSGRGVVLQVGVVSKTNSYTQSSWSGKFFSTHKTTPFQILDLIQWYNISVYTTVLYSCMCSYVEQDRILHRWVNGHGWHKWQLAVRISEKVQTVLWEMLVIYTALWWWHYHQYIDWQSFQEYYTYNHNYPYLCCPIKEHEASLGTSKNSF